MSILYIVVPCYNEEEVLRETATRLRDKIRDLVSRSKISDRSRIVFIDDGSKDSTWNIITGLNREDKIYSGIKLSRNRGHQNALLGGLMRVRDLADMTISMDSDLQDDIDAVDRFIDEFEKGCGVVYGVRNQRSTDTFFKRMTAESFYRLMRWMGAEIVFNHADYRLMSRQALASLAEFGEVNLFLRGIIPLVGYKTAVVTYERKPRFAGDSKYPIKKMLELAFESITSFSIKPIRLITGTGVGVFVVSILILAHFLFRYFVGKTIVGWASLAVSIWALGGLQLLAIGVIGEYIMKTYLETKQRPRFIIEEFINCAD